MINGNTLWRSANLTIGSGGAMLVSNTVGTVASIVTNLGTIRVENSLVTWVSNVVVRGSYISDPSTNTFQQNVTVSTNGSLVGGVGDLFDFKKNLIINSTNTAQFNLASSIVSFSGGVSQTNAVTGFDVGAVLAGFTATNFAYGTLTLTNSSTLVLESGGGSYTKALYLGFLDLNGNSNLVSDISSAFNVYYLGSEYESDNAYLGNRTFTLSGGGYLIPIVSIPEPSIWSLLVLGGCAVFLRRSNRGMSARNA
jgi:hypothetical protein